MTLDEAIRHCMEVAERQDILCSISVSDKAKENNHKCAEEHRQLAEWLRELKDRRQAMQNIRQEIEQAKCPTEPHNVDYNSAYNDGLDGALRIIDRHMKGGE